MSIHYFLILVHFLPLLSYNIFPCNNRLKFSSLKNGNIFIDDDKALDNGDSSEDYFDSFSVFDRFLFHRFSVSVAGEMPGGSNVPQNYRQLISLINEMTNIRPIQIAHDKGKNSLTKLFPSWLLKLYKIIFSK